MRALTKITSTIASKDDSSFLKGIFKTPTPKQRSCVIMQTEVYVKKLLTYQRGTVFGKAATLLVPLYLQTQLLGIMINNLHGGLTFVDKMIPATKITANNYLYDTMDLSVRQIEEAGGVVEAVIRKFHPRKFHTRKFHPRKLHPAKIPPSENSTQRKLG